MDSGGRMLLLPNRSNRGYNIILYHHIEPLHAIASLLASTHIVIGHCFVVARWDGNEKWPFISLDTKLRYGYKI